MLTAYSIVMLFRIVLKTSQLTQRRRKDVVRTSYFWPQRRLRLVWMKWKSRRPFFKTSSRRLPGDILKTSCKKRPKGVLQKTSSRPPFLVKAKDHLETICRLSNYVSFKLQTYYRSITRQTNYINLNKIR